MRGQLIYSRNLKSHVMESRKCVILLTGMVTIRFWDTRAITTQLFSAPSHSLQLHLMILEVFSNLNNSMTLWFLILVLDLLMYQLSLITSRINTTLNGWIWSQSRKQGRFWEVNQSKGRMTFSEKCNLSQNFILMLFILCDIFSIFKSQRGCQKPVLRVEPGAGDQTPHLHGAGSSFLTL